MKPLTMQQRTAAWFDARRGLPTCSRFGKILTPAKGEPSKSQQALICELIAEWIQPAPQGVVLDGPMTDEMRQGVILEAEARCCFEMQYAGGAKITEVGFVVHDSGLFGGSPDGLVGDHSGLEIKCPELKTHIGYVLDGGLPDDYKCQVHGSMIVTGRREWNFFSYSRSGDALPLHVVVKWDAFTDRLEKELFVFSNKLNEARAKFGLPPFPRTW